MIRTCAIYNATGPVRWGPLPDNLRAAEPEVQALAREEFKEAYANYVEFDTRSIPAMETANEKNREFIASALAGVEGGFDVLYQVAKKRFPKDSLPYDKLFLSADTDRFSPELRDRVHHIIRERLIPEYFGGARRQLLSEAAGTASAKGEPKMEGLVALYQKAGVHDYDWRDFGPALREMKWDYHTFDPPEKQAMGQRWRALPQGDLPRRDGETGSRRASIRPRRGGNPASSRSARPTANSAPGAPDAIWTSAAAAIRCRPCGKTRSC